MPKFSLRRLLPTLAALAVAGTLVACSGGDKEPEYVEKPVTDLYNQAVDLMNAGEYIDAAKAFDEVERQHPYSKWATKAQLMASYSYYQEGKYDDAIIALDRFIQLHPGSADTPYAYYLKALCFYEQISDVGRDQKMTKLAQQALEDIVTRFPNTEYARDARLKLDLTQDHLAGKEMEVGRFYLKAQQYLAAINRFRTVVERFDHTSHVPEALYRLTEAYTLLGLTAEAKKSAAVLGYNYPGSDWYDDAYDLVERGVTDPESNNEGGENSENSKSWLSKATSWF